MARLRGPYTTPKFGFRRFFRRLEKPSVDNPNVRPTKNSMNDSLTLNIFTKAISNKKLMQEQINIHLYPNYIYCSSLQRPNNLKGTLTPDSLHAYAPLCGIEFLIL